jgi:hypothetical protein
MFVAISPPDQTAGTITSAIVTLVSRTSGRQVAPTRPTAVLPVV